MIPPTVNGLPSMEVLSAMQKCIRRGMEREAMEFAVELVHTSKGFCTMVCNRLEIVSHEDIDIIAQPWIVPFVHTACEQARSFYAADKIGAARMMIGNAIRLMSRAKKSREGDHFHIAVGLNAIQEGFVPEVPEWAKDMHTIAGRSMGRGIDHFLSEGTQLSPPEPPDQYQAESDRRQRVKYAKEKSNRPTTGDLFECNDGTKRSTNHEEK